MHRVFVFPVFFSESLETDVLWLQERLEGLCDTAKWQESREILASSKQAYIFFSQGDE